MLLYEVIGVPVPWAAPQRFGNNYFSPKYKDKQRIIWQLKAQVSHEPLRCPIHLAVIFVMPIPKSTSKLKRQQMLHGAILPIGKPDRSNMLKMIEDCLQDAGILSNDSIIVDGPTKKIYGIDPKTVIRITTITEWQQGLQDKEKLDFVELPLFENRHTPTKTPNFLKRLKLKEFERSS